jgi:hypothetical protein
MQFTRYRDIVISSFSKDLMINVQIANIIYAPLHVIIHSEDSLVTCMYMKER